MHRVNYSSIREAFIQTAQIVTSKSERMCDKGAT